jgi:S1-C subfamily serine protease
MKKGFLTVLLSILAGGLTAYGVVKANERNLSPVRVEGENGSVEYRTVNLADSDYPDFTYAAESAVQAVVYVEVTVQQTARRSIDPFEYFFGFGDGYGFGQPQSREAKGSGSGVIIRPDGYIVTNNHVISGANKIYVTLDDSEKEYTAKLIGTDSANDIAVLKIDASGLTPAKLGDSSSVTAGDMAVVIGNPLGELGDSVSAGIISSTARKITLENQEMTLMQTDASINPGNSGGGMFDSKGQLIGIVVAKSSGTDIEALGFAIPVNTVSKAVENIMNGGGDDTSTQQDQNSQSNQNTDQYGNGQDQYGDSQDPFGSDPYGFFDFFGF